MKLPERIRSCRKPTSKLVILRNQTPAPPLVQRRGDAKEPEDPLQRLGIRPRDEGPDDFSRSRARYIRAKGELAFGEANLWFQVRNSSSSLPLNHERQPLRFAGNN